MPADGPEQDFSKLRVLVVDDDATVCAMLRITLERLGLSQITCVPNAQDALDAVRLATFDLAVVDWQLGDMEGGELIGMLRRATVKQGNSFEIFVLTGFPLTDRVFSAYRAGANEFLVKPLDSNTLRQRLASYLARQHMIAAQDRGRIAAWQGARG